MKEQPHKKTIPIRASRAKQTVSLDLAITGRGGREFRPFLLKNLLAAHDILRPPLRELSLALVGDRTMSELHLDYLNIPGPTDVLTFPLEMDSRGRAIGGEVIVCIPEARRQSKLRRTPLAHEILLYSLHGLLHLCGYDDRTEADYRAMHRKEDDVLKRLGIGAVFASP